MAGNFIGVFLVIIVAMYFLYPQFHPENKQNDVEEDEWGASDLTYNPDYYSLEAADSLKIQIELLQQSIDSLRGLEQQHLLKVDSLEYLANQMEEENLERDIPDTDTDDEDELVSAEELKDISRSLLELDEEELSPILNRLNNNELIGLYKSANNMQRSKMLRSLGPDKAAVILKEIM